MPTTGIYTGKGLAPSYSSGGGKAMSRLSDFIVKAEELKYQTFKQNEQEFLKNANIDPVFVLSDSLRKTQAGLLDSYNKKYSQVFKQYNGNIPTEVKQQMLSEKNYIVMEQQKMQSDMEQALQEKAIIEKDQGVNYDPVEWYNDKWLPFASTGVFSPAPLSPRAKPIEDIFGTRKITGASAYEETDPNNPTRLRIMSANRKEVAPRIVDTIFTDERVKKHALQEWADRTEEDKTQYLNDLNGDSIISEEERRQGDVLTKSLDNPIIKAYVDKHWGNLVDVKFMNKQRLLLLIGILALVAIITAMDNMTFNHILILMVLRLIHGLILARMLLHQGRNKYKTILTPRQGKRNILVVQQR